MMGKYQVDTDSAMEAAAALSLAFKSKNPGMTKCELNFKDGSKVTFKFKWSKDQLANLERGEDCAFCKESRGAVEIPNSHDIPDEAPVDGNLVCVLCAFNAGFLEE